MRCGDDQPYILEATRASIRKGRLAPIKQLLPTVGTALCAFRETFLKDVRSTVLSSEL